MAGLVRAVGLVVTFAGCWFCFGSLASGSPSMDRVIGGGFSILFGMLIFALGRILGDLFGGRQKVIVELRAQKRQVKPTSKAQAKARNQDSENWLDGIQ
jgi:hypothetical protein